MGTSTGTSIHTAKYYGAIKKNEIFGYGKKKWEDMEQCIVCYCLYKNGKKNTWKCLVAYLHTCLYTHEISLEEYPGPGSWGGKLCPAYILL